VLSIFKGRGLENVRKVVPEKYYGRHGPAYMMLEINSVSTGRYVKMYASRWYQMREHVVLVWTPHGCHNPESGCHSSGSSIVFEPILLISSNHMHCLGNTTDATIIE